MYKKRTLYLVAAFLIAEAVFIVLLPSRVPRAVRAITALTNAIAVAALWLVARQKSPPS